MKLDNLKALIIKKIQNNLMPHFIIFKDNNQNSELLNQFTWDILKTFSKCQEMNNEADILTITPKEDKSVYHVEELAPLFKFNQTNPINDLYKFAIFTQAHAITEIVANKLLKILEEPHPKLFIIMLNPYGVQLLPTIQSRAIEFQVPTYAIEQKSSYQIKEFEASSFHHFSDQLKKIPNLWKDSLSQIACEVSPQNNYNAKNIFLKLQTKLIEVDRFNASHNDKAFLLYRALEELGEQ